MRKLMNLQVTDAFTGRTVVMQMEVYFFPSQASMWPNVTMTNDRKQHRDKTYQLQKGKIPQVPLNIFG